MANNKKVKHIAKNKTPPNKGCSLFCMEDANVVLTMTLIDAKEYLLLKIETSTANDNNKTCISSLIKTAVTVQKLSFIIANHVLAHPGEGLKVIL